MGNRILIILLWSIFLVSTINLFGQEISYRAWNGSSYDTAVPFPPEGVADDYGPRGESPEYFHLGIDYNSGY